MKTLKSLLGRVMSVLLIPLLVIGGLPLEINNVFAAEGDDVPPTVVPEDAPKHGKKLVDNGDGTYTLSLSVTGKASSSTTQEVTKSNVILLIDTSSSMNSNATGYNGSRLAAEKNALTKTDGIIDKLLANNGNTTETADIIELYGINFGTGGTRAWDWSTNGTTIKNAINNLSTNRGTNWEEALSLAKVAADTKHAAEPNDNTYIILLTDGQPTTDQTRPENNRHIVNTNYSEEWGYASDDARAIVNAGYALYGVYTFGPTNISSTTTCDTPDSGGSICLKGLINYAYTGTGTANSSLASNYTQYFYDATDTQALIDALEAIVNEITSIVGYTNIAITDGLTDLTSSMKVDGKISNLTYTRSGGSYGSGTVWTDAPAATTTNGAINWNLGSRVLEDGVTYTVSFVVWPSQESYDLVADLNNGKRTYESLSASQRASIINTDGVYTLKTNTDYPTLTYSTVTTTTSNTGTETVVSTPTTFSIKNPDPVGLKNQKLTLEKKWEDSLDPSQREEVNGEVTLDFYRDDQPYEQSITLTEESEWKLKDYISIAPGILLSSDSDLYDSLKAGHTEYSFGGKTYIILETGHDYYFEEKDINNHFELTNYVYHPMVVKDKIMNVFFTRDGSGNITGIEKFENMDTVSATNTLKGGINIEKKVVDKDNKTVNTNDSFKITVHLVDSDGNPYNYDYRIYYGEKNPEYESHIVYNDDGSVKYSRSGHIYDTDGTGIIEETIYVGDTIRIVNVDAGVEYYVVEEAKAGYSASPEITYEEKYGNSTTSTSSVSTSDGYYVVSGNTASSVIVKNKFLDEKTKVDFEKTWYGTDGKVLSGKTLPGSITVELFKKGADGKVVSTGKTKDATAETSWKASFTNLPKYDNGVEIVYSIKESAIEGATYNDQQDAFFEYDVEENNGQHAIVGRWKVMTLEDYILRNTWTPATESVSGLTSFSIKKIDASTKKPLEGAVFELKLSSGKTISKTTDKNGEATFDNLDAGEYSLKETAAPSDYQAISTEPTISITKIKKLNQVDLANLNNVFEYVFSISATNVTGYTYDTETRTYTVKNEPIPYADIIASKVWNDENNRDGLRKNYANYYVAVKDNSGKYVAYQKLVLENKNYEFKHLPKKTVNGETITYEIVEASACSGSGSNIQCTEFEGDKNYSVSTVDDVITNTHKPATTSFKIKKIWDTSAGTLPSVAPGFVTVEVTNDKNDKVETVTLRGEDYATWEGDFEGYTYEAGEKITYTVTEKTIGEGGVLSQTTKTLYVYEDEVLKGKWVASYSGPEVTNTWTPVSDKVEYNGADKFTIKKTDENGDKMPGVTFTVNGEDKKTNSDGKIEVSVPVSEDKKTDNLSFSVSEKATLEGYDLVNGSATVAVTCTSELSDMDETTLTNTYTKTCEFAKSGSKDYTWNGTDKILAVTNNRSMAASLVLRKNISGVTGQALRDNGLKFTLTGPEDFTAQEISFSDFTKKDDGVYEYEVSGRIPTGNYKVVESGAEFKDLLTLTVTGDNNKAKAVTKDDEAEFEITNSYEKIRDVSYSVAKVWEDDSNRDNVRPKKLKITLLRNNSEYRTVELDDEMGWFYEWTDLPRAGEDATLYEYKVVEDVISDYASDGGKMKDGVFTFTNTHDVALYGGDGILTVTKAWNADDKFGQPMSATVELWEETEDIAARRVNNKNITNPLTITSVNNWTVTFENLPANINGKTITYSVRESNMKVGAAEFNFVDAEDSILVMGDDVIANSNPVQKSVEGKWTKKINGYNITNEWTPATFVYNGKTEFYLKKVDGDNKAMSGIKFEIGGEEKETDTDGKIKIEIPEATDTSEDDLSFVIKETEGREGYDPVDGSATIKVTSTSELSEVDETALINTYIKTYEFVKSGSDKYSWDADSKTLTVINERSLADSLTIEKTFSGVSKEALKDLTFTITGPEDFGTNGEMTIRFADDCTVTGSKATCKLNTRIPTGKYMVKENNAELEHFTLTVAGDGVEKKVERDDKAVFKIDNKYEVDKTTYSVSKIWDDDDDRDGVRPAKLSVELLANGKVKDSVELEKGKDYQYTWTNLPVVDEDAKAINYSVEEEIPGGYNQIGADIKDGSTVFTNQHIPALINDDDSDPDNDGKLKVNKTWVDENNLLNTRPSNITINLYANGGKIATAIVTPDLDGNWEHEFEGLYKYEAGEEIEYKVEEENVDGYKVSYRKQGYDYVLTNTIKDPCIFGGCGGIVPPIAPETGEFTKSDTDATHSIDTNSIIGGLMVVTMSGVIVISTMRRKSIGKK